MKGKAIITLSRSELTDKNLEKTKLLDVSDARIVSFESLKESPSHRTCSTISKNLELHWQNAKYDVKPDKVAWQAEAVSAVVIGVAHNAHESELDWWD